MSGKNIFLSIIFSIIQIGIGYLNFIFAIWLAPVHFLLQIFMLITLFRKRKFIDESKFLMFFGLVISISASTYLLWYLYIEFIMKSFKVDKSIPFIVQIVLLIAFGTLFKKVSTKLLNSEN